MGKGPFFLQKSWNRIEKVFSRTERAETATAVITMGSRCSRHSCRHICSRVEASFSSCQLFHERIHLAEVPDVTVGRLVNSMERDDLFACHICGKEFRNPGALGRHILSCDPKVEETLHEQRAEEARLLQKAALLAEQAENPENEAPCDVDNTEDIDESLEMQISELMQAEGKKARFEGAALATTTMREQLFMPDRHVQYVKEEVSRYCDEGVDLAARRVAARWNLPEEEVNIEMASVFEDYKELGGTNKEKRITDVMIAPVYPCTPRVLGTRRNDKGKLIVVSFASFSSCLLFVFAGHHGGCASRAGSREDALGPNEHAGCAQESPGL